MNLFSVVCRVHGARETLRISTSCFAAFPKKGKDDTDYYDDDTDKCDDDHDDTDYEDDEKIIINLPGFPGLLFWLVGAFPCIHMECGEWQSGDKGGDDDDGDGKQG